MLVESLHSAVFFSVSTTHSIVDEMLLLNLNSYPTLQLYVTFEPGSHGVAVEMILLLATIEKSPQTSTTISSNVIDNTIHFL